MYSLDNIYAGSLLLQSTCPFTKYRWLYTTIFYNIAKLQEDVDTVYSLYWQCMQLEWPEFYWPFLELFLKVENDIMAWNFLLYIPLYCV